MLLAAGDTPLIRLLGECAARGGVAGCVWMRRALAAAAVAAELAGNDRL